MLGKIVCISAIIVIIAIFLFLFIGMFIKKNISIGKIKVIMISLAFSLTILSYFLNGTGGQDLDRYIDILEYIQNQDDSYMFTEFKYKDAPLTTLWFFIVAKIGDLHLITTIPTLLTFGILLYICLDVYRNSEEKKFNHFCIAFLLSMCFLEVIILMSTVRYCTAAAIVLLALYRDIIKKKKNWLTIILYVIPLLIHYYVFLIIFIRILSLINLKYFNVIFLCSYFILNITSIILSVVNVEKIQKIGKLLNGYLSMDAIDFRFIICNAIFMLVVLVIYIMRYILLNRSEKEKMGFKQFFNGDYYKENYVQMNFSMTMLGFAPCSHLIRRISIPIMIINFPCIYEFLNILDKNRETMLCKISIKTIKRIFFVGFVIIIVGMWIYQIFGWKVWSLTCF